MWVEDWPTKQRTGEPEDNLGRGEARRTTRHPDVRGRPAGRHLSNLCAARAGGQRMMKCAAVLFCLHDGTLVRGTYRE